MTDQSLANIQPTLIHGLPLPDQVIGQTYYIGVDEVARGCLAGPVVSCAMCLDISKVRTLANSNVPKICDSKKLTPKARALAETWIKPHALSYGIGQASVTEIDTVNIREATFLAMNRALALCISSIQQNTPNPATLNIIVDGNAFKIMPGFEDLLARPNVKITTLVKGDALDINIACASIIAKEFRDNALDALVQFEPDLAKYCWVNNRAYGTAEHIRLIREHGVSQHHRRTFLKKVL